MAGTGEPTQHPSPHLLLRCGEILWSQGGRLGELDLPVGAGNEPPSITQQWKWKWTCPFNVLPKRCTKLTAPHSPARTAASECVLYLQTRNTVSLL